EVPPLALADPDRLDVDALSRNEAVELFVARAQAVKREFSLSESNAATVHAICARLEGLPLALELAAARITTLTPQALLGRLDERLNVLTGGTRDADERQRTLRNTIEWSYELLDEPEQRLFEGLSVFVDGCQFDA